MAMRLHNLQPRPGAKHRVKRLGCGTSSGHGKTSTRGGKGQTARSGGSIRLGFEGGQMPLIRRIPKRGFNNKAFRVRVLAINVGDLDGFEAGTTVTPALLRERGLLKERAEGVKILGDGELKTKLTVQAQRFSATARAKITQAGGTCVELPWPGIRHQDSPAPTAGTPPAGAEQ